MSSNYYYTTIQKLPRVDLLELSASFGSNINAGSPVDGDPVYFMGDTSGNNIDFVQATLLNQPIYRDSGFGTNNMPYVEFDGINDSLRFPLFGRLSVPYTGFIVAQLTGTVGTVLSLASVHWVTLGYGGDKMQVVFGSGDSDISPILSTPITDPHLFDWVQKVGIQTTSNYNGNFLMTLNPNASKPSMGGPVNIGVRGGGAWCGMKLAEIRLYDGELTASQIASVQNDLNNKYGLY
jgi:hypothetical protein